jgi:hypothetical protein
MTSAPVPPTLPPTGPRERWQGIWNLVPSNAYCPSQGQPGLIQHPKAECSCIYSAKASLHTWPSGGSKGSLPTWFWGPQFSAHVSKAKWYTQNILPS